MAVSDAVGPNVKERMAMNRPERHIPGEPGIWILLFGDMMVFTILFGVYLHARSKDVVLFAASQESLNQTFGALNTLILLTSSLLVVMAVRAFRSEQWRHLAIRLGAAGVAVGCCFVIIKAFEYHEKISAGITPTTNEFFMYYFVLTGLHLAHVIIGLLVLTVCLRLLRNPKPSATHISFYEGAGCFWHMVDLLWIVIFPLLFLVR